MVAPSSSGTPLTEAQSQSGPLELLVHNISHSDMYLLLKQQQIGEGPVRGPSEGEGTLLARPQFNSFQPASELILEHLDMLEAKHGPPEVLSCSSKYKVHYAVGLGLTQKGLSSGSTVLPEEKPNAESPWERFHLKATKQVGPSHRD